MVSSDLSHGIRSRASIYFCAGPQQLGVVTNVDQPNYNGLTAYAYCFKTDFAERHYFLRTSDRSSASSDTRGKPDYGSEQAIPCELNWIPAIAPGAPEPPV